VASSCVVSCSYCGLLMFCLRDAQTAAEHRHWPDLATIQITKASRVLVHNLIVSHLFTFQFLIPANLSTYLNGLLLWPILSHINPILSYLTLNIIGIAQSAWRPATCWTVRESNSGGSEIFRIGLHRSLVHSASRKMGIGSIPHE